MRINPVNYNTSPFNKPNAARNSVNSRQSAANMSDTLCFRGNQKLRNSELDTIAELIKRTDAGRLDEAHGTVQGVYPYGKFIVKSPEPTIHDTSVKEYVILNRLKEDIKGGESIAPKPYTVAQTGNRPYLVEELIPGVHSGEFPMELDDIKELIKDKFIPMDKAGIVNEDLSPRNIMVRPDGSTRIIDFDTFSYLSNSGRPIHSKTAPVEYFAALLPEEKFSNMTRKDSGMLKTIKTVNPSDERFLASFAVDRKIPVGMDDLIHARNLSDNPFISVPSNLTSYESRTIYQRIMAHDIENPIEFIQDYLQLKTNEYHVPMREYLKKLAKSSDTSEAGMLSTEQGAKKLQQAIDFEDLMIGLFSKEKPNVYFAKLEAAKMQLNALLFDVDIARGISNREQIPRAYENLIRVITEGMEAYTDPSQKAYLEAELNYYRGIFANTNLAVTIPKQNIEGSMDILGMWFSDCASDGNSFARLQSRAKDIALDALRPDCPENGIQSLSGEELIKKRRSVAEAIIKRELEPAKNKVSKAQYQKGFTEAVNEVLQEADAGNFDKMFKPAVTSFCGGTGIKEAAQAEEIVSTVAESTKNGFKQLAKKYQNEKYLKLGNKLFVLLGALAVAGAIGAKQYFSAKNKKKELEKEIVLKADNEMRAVKNLSPESASVYSKFLK